MNSIPPSRLAWIDWLRGLACLLMFQTHCYDAWLSESARHLKFFVFSQLGGTFPAPLFLFLAGTSLALASDRLLRAGNTWTIAQKAVRRGVAIWALGFMFRVQEFLISYGWAPGSDLFRVDILNTIGVSIVLLGLLFAALGRARQETLRAALFSSALAAAALIAFITPWVWTSWRPRGLPWPLESYMDGVHNLGTPQPGLFPLFPWAGFAFAGLALGVVLTSERFKRLGGRAFLALGGAGALLIYLARLLDHSRIHLYPVYDFWHTSPNFFLLRVGSLLVLAAVAYAWSRWGLCGRVFSPLVQLGTTSLLVYWVHLEFVYGRFSILPRHGQSILRASGGLLVITCAMLVLSWGRTTWKNYGKLAWREGKFSPIA